MPDKDLLGPTTLPHLQDPFATRGIVLLDGRLERAGFPPALTIIVSLIAGFLAFQGVSLVVVLVLVASGGMEGLAGLDLTTMVDRYAGEFLIANTVGQFTGLLAFSWLLARLHGVDVRGFLRLRGADPLFIGVAIVGLAALEPVVQWLGTTMDALPWPEWIRSFEQAQIELIEQVLAQNLGLWFTLFTMAITPALCEEVFFRGYIQRQAERIWRWPTAILFSGIIFGLYHLRLTQAVPLSLLGVYMAYLTWRSGSVLPAILVHFANNGLAVFLGAYVSARPDLSAADIESMEVPGYILAAAVVTFSGLAVLLHRRGASLRAIASSRNQPPEGQT